MRTYSLSHVSDRQLLRDLASLVATDRITTAQLLAHIAEFDARRLYLPAAYPSTFAYCTQELHLSEDAAYKRITAARLARRFPAIFGAVAEGRLNLTSLGLLAPHLSPGNARELLAASSGRNKLEVQELIASKFPRSESLTLVETAASEFAGELAPERVESATGDCVTTFASQLAPERIESAGSARPRASHELAARPVGLCSKVTPIARERFLVQLSIGRDTNDKLRKAQELLGHQLPSGDLASVLDRALDALVEKLERRKFAATARARAASRPATRANARTVTATRYIPAHVKRAVWERDGCQCTFVSESGRRCGARKCLEFDHIEPVARGGRASVAGIRLRCRAHNQYAAECVFGAGFMRRKREGARSAAAGRQAAEARQFAGRQRHSAAEARQRLNERPEPGAPGESVRDVIAPLRILGFSADEARRAAALCDAIPDAPLEQRVRHALRYFRPPGLMRPAPDMQRKAPATD